MVRRRVRRALPTRARSRVARTARLAPPRRPAPAHLAAGHGGEPGSAIERVAGAVGTVALGAFHLGSRAFDETFLPPRATATHVGTLAAPTDRSTLGRELLIRRVFVAGVGALPLTCLVAAGTGAAIVLQSTMAPTPPSPELGRLMVVLILRELAPLLTVILIAGHSATAGDEVEPAAHRADPRVAMRAFVGGTAIAALTVAVHFAAVAMIAAYATSALLTLRTPGAVHDGFVQELALFDLPLFLVKGLSLGALVGTMGWRAAGEAPRSTTTAHRAFVGSLLACAAVSIGMTMVIYAIVGAPPPP